jgi:glutamine transport system permease protein
VERLLDLNWSIAIDVLPLLLTGLKFTIIIAVCGLFLGFIVGIVVGLSRMSKIKLIYGLATVFLEIIRGTPIVVQALYLYFGVNYILSQAGLITFNPIVSGIIIIAINSGAYISEIVRGSIQSIDKGQTEAGRSLGLTKYQAFYHIVWPQAFKRMIPPLGNQFIISLKDTSLLLVIAVPELTRQSNIAVARTFAPFEIYTTAAVMYLILTLSISFILKKIERRLDV